MKAVPGGDNVILDTMRVENLTTACLELRGYKLTAAK
jgi:hypothetical protein